MVVALDSLVFLVVDLDQSVVVEPPKFDVMPGGQVAAQLVAVHRGRP